MIEKDVLGEIMIKVTLSPLLKQFHDQEEKRTDLENQLVDYVADLIADLSLPFSVKVEISSNDDEYTFIHYRIDINGKKCRILISTMENLENQVIELARLLMSQIYDNRELFLTKALSEEIFETIIASKAIKIERIISKGHSSPKTG